MGDQVHDFDQDIADLAEHGYKQKLHRSLGSFSSFAAGFSYISILTGMFQLFGFGYGFGGPLMFWSWLIVMGGQFCVALVFGELSARYPIAGSVYQWSKKVSSRPVSWMAGWTMLVGSVVTVASVSIAEQIVLPQIWSGFNFFPDDAAKNAVTLGIATIVLTTILNMLGVRVMSIVNNIGVAIELVGVALIIVVLAFHIQRGPGVIFTTQGIAETLPGWSSLGLLAPLLMAAIMPAYVMYGFDTAGSLAEETKNPRKTTPRAILQALGTAGTAGAILLILALMVAPSLAPADLATGGLPYVLESALGDVGAKVLLVIVATAIFVCTLAIQTASIRLAFSMARDHALPFGEKMSHVSSHRQSPVVPAIVSGLFAIGLLAVNIGNASVFLVITSVAIVIVYLAYFLVTAPVLKRRFAGWPDDQGREGWFFLGRVPGLIINSIAVIYGAIMMINLVWPRAEVYGAYPWGGVLFVGGVVLIGAIYYATVQRGREIQIATEHRVDETSASAS